MLTKPFRTPLLEKSNHGDEHRSKRQRIAVENVVKRPRPEPFPVYQLAGISTFQHDGLQARTDQASEGNDRGSTGGQGCSYYKVLWRKFSTRKHKPWEGDGILSVVGTPASATAHLQDIDSGTHLGKTYCSASLLLGSVLNVCGNDIEIESALSEAEYLALKPACGTQIDRSQATTTDYHISKPGAKNTSTVSRPLKSEAVRKNVLNRSSATSFSSQAGFKNPLSSAVVSRPPSKAPCPRHDPLAKKSIVMKRPKNIPEGKNIVDVVVDPILTQHLREHQREGVKFLYECVMGLRDFDGQGAILADEMGLGKSLQVIALLWTLLKQNPYYEDTPIIRKAIIVCPVTLINNWRKEFRKWLGIERIGVFVADETKKRITDFTHGKAYSVMVIGYERLRSVQDDLTKGSGIDIVIADEGHRLKTAKNKSAQAIKALNMSRRVILSGTPIQNDLSEFFMMVDFVNPSLLGSFKTFTREFEGPISKSRQPGALRKDIEKGEWKTEELVSLTNSFILRRTAETLAKYLPPKTEYVLFCRPTDAQAKVYRHVLSCPAFHGALGNPEVSLQLITVLKKVCNSPTLLSGKPSEDLSKPVSHLSTSILAHVPSQLLRNNSTSTKIRALDQLLHSIRSTTSEKVVLISNYTSTLDVLGTLLTSVGHPFLRLDGSTPATKRQHLVDTFNRSPASSCFAFLLSAKSGGLGLNLVGASRLVLFDVDWNPATDLQAMARIHRDGQKNHCVIYRFLMAGGIDEKIWQRQVTKLGLAGKIMENKSGASSFTKEELKDLFRLDEGLSCQTHDLISCPCRGRGVLNALPPEGDAIESLSNISDELLRAPKLIQASKLDMDQQEREISQDARPVRMHPADSSVQPLMEYTHIDSSKFAAQDDEELEMLIEDNVLLNILKDDSNRISFVFAKAST
ncbi:MAG: hypothetical protein LQ342_006418 [Letrouitia transgressa]|nr:MAG: hypothetical protein LQ342_006418 [Letrouitia transgressa]